MLNQDYDPWEALNYEAQEKKKNLYFCEPRNNNSLNKVPCAEKYGCIDR